MTSKIVVLSLSFRRDFFSKLRARNQKVVLQLQTPECVDGFCTRRNSVLTSTDWERKGNGLARELGSGKERKTGYFQTQWNELNGKRVSSRYLMRKRGLERGFFTQAFNDGFSDGKTT